MNKIGVIYIGANSVKFTLMNVLDSGYYKIIDESSSDIKLAQDLINSDEISEQKINATLSNLLISRNIAFSIFFEGKFIVNTVLS